MRLLFITSNRLGDAILSTGLLGYYIKQHPGAEVTVVCGKVPAPLFRNIPEVVEIIAVAKEPFAAHWLKLYGRLFGNKWDLMVDLRHVGMFRFLPAAKRVLGGVPNFRGHKLEEFAALIGSAQVPAPVISLGAEAIATAKTLIPENEINTPIIALGATTGPKRKRWRPENYAAVMAALTEPTGILPGARIAVIGAPNEREQADPIIKLLPASRTLNLVGTTDVLTGAAVVSHCALYVGADSGLMHLAATMDVPTLGLFGEHGVPQTYRPWGTHTAHVHRRNPNWDVNDKPSAMDGISAAEVIAAAEELVRRAGVSGKHESEA